MAAFAPVSLVLAQEPSWLREFGSSTDDAAFTVSIADDGGCYVAGYTLGFWFAGGVDPEDIFLTKFDGAGAFQWGVQFGAAGDDSVQDAIPDGAGGLFLAGDTFGDLGGPSAGGFDAWFGRWDSAGARVWVRQVGTSGWDVGSALAPDGEGGCFVAGHTDAPGPAGQTWFARCNASGDTVWFYSMVSTTVTAALAPDGAGGFFAAGATTASFGGPLIGFVDAWVGRFNSNGKLLWARQPGTIAWDAALGVSQDGQGGVFVSGSTQGPLGGPHLGGNDAWIARYDHSGNQVAIRQFGTAQSDGGGQVTLDGMGGAFMAANTGGSLGGPTAGSADVYVAHLDGDLNIQWIDQFGSSMLDQTGARGIALAGPGSVFVCGWTLGNIPGSGGGGGGTDAWLARYDLCYPDCNADGVLTVADFGCFQTRFITADMYTDCNADGVLTVSDFGCFQTKFVVGCP